MSTITKGITMEQQKRIETIIYGGAFNPPTLAHLAILQACIVYARPISADVWIMPSGDRVDKPIGVNPARRLEYITAMIADSDTEEVRVHVLTTELERTLAVETSDTVLELEESYPDRQFTWVFGADSTETMAEWQNGDWLLENLTMLVVNRVGHQINPLAKRALALTVPTINVSSTLVRQRLEADQDVTPFVSPSVLTLLVV